MVGPPSFGCTGDFVHKQTSQENQTTQFKGPLVIHCPAVCFYPHPVQQWDPSLPRSPGWDSSPSHEVGGNEATSLFFFTFLYSVLCFLVAKQPPDSVMTYTLQHISCLRFIFHRAYSRRPRVSSAENHVHRLSLEMQMFCICERKEGRR